MKALYGPIYTIGPYEVVDNPESPPDGSEKEVIVVGINPSRMEGYSYNYLLDSEKYNKK